MDEIAQLALSMTREQFSARFACWFLCSDAGVAGPQRPQPTDVWQLGENTASHRLADLAADGPPFAAPIKKVQASFPSMITVGRTQNNDIVVPDTSISKFHAFFRVTGGVVVVADAGSRNGTFVAGRALPPKQPMPLRAGEHLQLARLAFVLLEPDRAWNWLVQQQDQWG